MPTGSKAPGCGEAALLPPQAAKTKPQVLAGAVPPWEEIRPKPQRFPPLIIYRLPDTKKPLLRVELFL